MKKSFNTDAGRCMKFIRANIMHPDQPTEAIVDAALAHGKPFAVVPCCVFPSLFPHRQLRTGQGVNTYSGFVRYLLEKDPRIQQARLPFAGRSRVVWWGGPRERGAAAVANKNKTR